MPATDPRSAPIRTRRALALGLSAAAHAALLCTVTLAPWPSADRASSRRLAVVWLRDLPIRTVAAPQPNEPAAEAVETPSETVSTSPIRPDEAASGAREAEAARIAVDATARSVEREPATLSEPGPRAQPPEPRRPRRYLRPQIDFDEERRRAAAKVIEQQQRRENYATFSTDDLAERTPPEPVPIVPRPDVPHDNCVIAKGKLQQLAMMMMMRCVRPPRADMFAALKPAYLTQRPLCTEVRFTPPPRAPGAREDERVAIKCRLVDEEELLAARGDLDSAR